MSLGDRNRDFDRRWPGESVRSVVLYGSCIELTLAVNAALVDGCPGEPGSSDVVGDSTSEKKLSERDLVVF